MKPLFPRLSYNLGLKIEEHSYILNYLGALLVIVGLLMLLPLVPYYFSVHKMVSLSWVVKFTYIMGMLAGRLEILPLAMLFAAIFRRR